MVCEDKMESPFYHDDSAAPNFAHIPDYDRFQGKKGFSGGLGVKMPSAGTSTDLLKLSSPDLEHLIIQSNQGQVTTSPAPPGSSHPFVYREQATHEQEGFADGFVRALADLHKQNQLYQRSPLSAADTPVYTDLSSCGPAPQSRDAPQTVPESLSPAQPDAQERVRAERKKLRNRIAASKCRRRKLERISRLEEKVKLLKSHNSELSSTAGLLREQVTQLRHKLMNHVSSGCHITVQPGDTKSPETPATH